MDAGIGSGIEAVQQVGPLQHHGSGGCSGCGLLLPAELQQIDACEGGGRGSGSTIRLKGAEDASGGGSCSCSGCSSRGGFPLFALLGGSIAEAIAQYIRDGEGQRWLRLLRLLMLMLMCWWRQAGRASGHGGRIIHIDVVVLLLLLLGGRCGCGLIVEAIAQYGIILLLLDGQRGGRRGAGAGGVSARRTAGAEPLLQCSRMQCGGSIESRDRMREYTNSGRGGGQLLLMELLQLLQLMQMLQLLLLLVERGRSGRSRLQTHVQGGADWDREEAGMDHVLLMLLLLLGRRVCWTSWWTWR